MRQQIIIYESGANGLWKILREQQPRKLFLVTGKTSFYQSGASEIIAKLPEEIEYVRFSEFSSIPKLEDIEKGRDLFFNSGCDFIIGIGGGCVIDIAKSLSILSGNVETSQVIAHFIKSPDTLPTRRIGLAILPTTTGSGSESTHFAVVYIGLQKYSIAHPSLLPDYAILDPQLTLSLPPTITAYTGMDALSQGIESFWSVNATPESAIYSEKAITLTLSWLEKNVKNPDLHSRKKMQLASNYAGRAINITKTTASHSVSYPLTSMWNVPHGHAVALTLPSFIEFNSDVSEENLQEGMDVTVAKARMSRLLDLLDVKSGRDGKRKITALIKSIDLETHLSLLGIKEKDIDTIIQNGFNTSRMANNPKIVTAADLNGILKNIL